MAEEVYLQDILKLNFNEQNMQKIDSPTDQLLYAEKFNGTCDTRGYDDLKSATELTEEYNLQELVPGSTAALLASDKVRRHRKEVRQYLDNASPATQLLSNIVLQNWQPSDDPGILLKKIVKEKDLLGKWEDKARQQVLLQNIILGNLSTEGRESDFEILSALGIDANARKLLYFDF